MGGLIIAIGIIIMAFGIFSIIVNLIKKKVKPNQDFNAYKRQLDAKFHPFVLELERMFEENESKPLNALNVEIFEKTTGLNAEQQGLSTMDKLLGLEGWEDSPEKSDLYITGEYLNELESTLNSRWVREYLKFDFLNDQEVLSKYGLNIKDDEYLIYKVSNIVDIYEEKQRVTRITYSGFSTNFRSGSLKYKLGSLRPIVNKEDYWDSFDACKVFFLNKRIVFIGTQKKKNKFINYDDILTGELFENGLLLSLANSKKVLLNFADYANSPVKRDDLNIFTRVLNRVLEKTTDKDLF